MRRCILSLLPFFRKMSSLDPASSNCSGQGHDRRPPAPAACSLTQQAFIYRAVSKRYIIIMSKNTSSCDPGKAVAIVGAGALGLVATRNLIEEGFEVTTFERNSYVGGLWHANQDPDITSALVGTVSNGSKQVSAFSDFPMPDCESCKSGVISSSTNH